MDSKVWSKPAMMPANISVVLPAIFNKDKDS